MLFDGISLVEGSQLLNATVAYGADFPSNPNTGELFFKTSVGLHVYSGSSWNLLEASSNLSTHAADDTLHLTTSQNSWIDAIAATSTEVNYLSGVTSAIQTQLNNKQTLDGDLTAIAGLVGTSGLLRKSAVNTWALDTNTYLTGNQTITLSGVVSGSGSTSITTTWNGTASNIQMGSLGVGTAASGTTGEIRATNNITAYYSSDARLKENVRPIENALAKVEQLNGVTYDWTDAFIEAHGGEDGYFIRKHDVGVIAQEVEAVMPEIVVDREDGYKAVKYERMVALLIEAVKELSAEVEMLKTKLGE